MSGAWDTLLAKLEKVEATFSDQIAIVCGNESYTYGTFFRDARRLSAGLRTGERVGIHLERGYNAYVAVLACVLAKCSYVPLPFQGPVSRLQSMISEAELERVLASPSGCLNLSTAEYFTRDASDVADHLGFEVYESHESRRDGRNFLYILFTSGTTGVPKGVPVSDENLMAYLRSVQSLSSVDENSRCSQTFELTFDLSVHDMFVTWTRGATLVYFGAEELFYPAAAIRSQQLTHWFSVPSVAMIMGKSGQLRCDSFPQLKQSLFCGEALMHATAAAWQSAASNSEIWNLYGPTEATIAITSYKFDLTASSGGTVSIGQAFPDQRVFLERGSYRGELLLQGSQVVAGYLNSPELTAEKFSCEPCRRFRSGDLVTLDEDGNYSYISRLDSQVKVRGYRIELGEIESALRASQLLEFAYVTYKTEADGLLVAHINEISELELQLVQRELADLVPSYMIPTKWCRISAAKLPLNANGKVDKSAL